MSKLVDSELLRAAQEGSTCAPRLIVQRHNQRLYRVARAIVQNDTEAEDVLQEAYLSAFSNLTNFRADASLSTWLTRIVVNKAIDRSWKHGVSIDLDALDNTEELRSQAVGMVRLDGDPEEVAARSQARELLERAIESLPAPFRVVFMMRLVEQLSVKETASSLGIPEETVKSRLHRARKLMREQLQTELGSTLTEAFSFQGSRCAKFTDTLIAQLVPSDHPGSHSHRSSDAKQ